MFDYCYANHNDDEEVERVMGIIKDVLDQVQRDLRYTLPYDYEFVGACSYNMITYEPDELNALEFDVDIFPELTNGRYGNYKSYDVHSIFIDALIRNKWRFRYEIYENDDNIEIRINDSYSCCFYLVYNCTGKYAGLQKYIGYDYDEEKYLWWNYTTEYRSIPKKVEWLKNNRLWNKFRADFLRIKNRNVDESPKVLFMDSVLRKCREYGKIQKVPAAKAEPKKITRYDFEYVNPALSDTVREKIEELIRKVQEDISAEYTFQYQFVGSSARNMITADKKGNVGFDFDVNIILLEIKCKDSPEHLRAVLFNAIQRIYKSFGFNSKVENSTSVITIKKVDHKSSKCLYSCDFAIVRTTNKGRQQNIVLRKNNQKQSYVWEDRGDYYSGLSERVEFLKKNSTYWNELRRYYIKKKNTNYCEDKKSRSIYAEAVKEICDKHGYHK
jgi:hypothetical protein